MAVPKVVRCCCGVGCSVCWVVIGVWAFFFLGILALLFHKGKQGNVGHFEPGTEGDITKTLFITWIIYVVFTIGCGINLFYRIKHPFPPAEDPDAQKDQFSVIGQKSTVGEALLNEH